MLDGLFEKLKDEDFKRKQAARVASEAVEISYYLNFLKKLLDFKYNLMNLTIFYCRKDKASLIFTFI